MNMVAFDFPLLYEAISSKIAGFYNIYLYETPFIAEIKRFNHTENEFRPT